MKDGGGGQTKRESDGGHHELRNTKNCIPLPYRPIKIQVMCALWPDLTPSHGEHAKPYVRLQGFSIPEVSLYHVKRVLSRNESCTTSPTANHKLTFLPLDTDNKGDLPIDRIIGDEPTSRRDAGAEEDGRVDVQSTLSTAWRPDDRGECDVALDLVVLG